MVCVVDISGNMRWTGPERPIRAQLTSTAIKPMASIIFCHSNKQISKTRSNLIRYFKFRVTNNLYKSHNAKALHFKNTGGNRSKNRMSLWIGFPRFEIHFQLKPTMKSHTYSILIIYLIFTYIFQ